ncbi:amidohydrolase [Subtercola lobariae]|uniref:Amidohydrolase n=2 Tax=Subtercola lobariae TaxID=1588641 RepID=A0A917EUF7_9MICO|nr:amidohydrolase [Subtercola lobariae]
MQMPSWNRAEMLSFMDANTIGFAVASTGLSVHFGDDSDAYLLARRCNDFIAELVRERPDRFGGFGVLPLPLVRESIEEIDRVFDDLGLDGIMLSTNYVGSYLGDPVFDAVFEALERRATVVFVHPSESPDAAAHSLGLPDFVIDYVADTTRAIARLHYSNTFARTPSVRYVFSHAGGTIPFIAQRFDLLDSLNIVHGAELRRTAREQFRRLFFDTALAYQQPVIRLATEVVGLSQLVFGSDRPYAAGFSAEAAQAIQSDAYLSDQARAAIGWGNAQMLLPRLAD